MTEESANPFGLSNLENDLSNDEIDRYVARLEELRTDYKKLETDCNQYLLRRHRERIGPRADRMLCSQDAAVAGVGDPEPAVRHAAICFAVAHWSAASLIIDACKQLSISDSDCNVRQAAIGAIGVHYAKSNNALIARLMISIIRDDNTPFAVRSRAYCALMRVHGVVKSELELLTIKAPEDFDWSFIQRLDVP